MALSKYYDVYSLTDYKRRVELIESEKNTLLSSDFFSSKKEELLQQIKTLKEKEEKIFELLKVKDLDDLNLRLEDYKQAVINFSGQELYQEFIGILEEKNKEEFLAFNNAIEEIFKTEIYNNSSYEEIGQKFAHDQAMKILNKGLVDSKGKNKKVYYSLKGFKQERILPGSFTREQKKRWRKLIHSEFSGKGEAASYYANHFDENGDIIVEAVEGDNDITLSTTLTWEEITQGLKPTDAKKLENKKPGTIDEINRKMRDFIVSKVRGEDKYLIYQIINHILQEEQYAFFVGDSTTQISGILGEIQGIYYIAKFLGDDYSAALKWKGGKIEGNSKPHQDIILNGLGIQVKNSTEDDLEIMKKISFKEGKLENIFDEMNISPEAKNLFENYYATLAFNVPYHKDNRRKKNPYVSGLRKSDQGADIYEINYEALQSYSKDIEKLLSVFAAAFMYLDVEKEISGQDLNTLFLIAGASFQTGANILSGILQQLEEGEKRFNIRASYKNDQNIIAALNAEKRGHQFTKQVLADITLKSSYNF